VEEAMDSSSGFHGLFGPHHDSNITVRDGKDTEKEKNQKAADGVV
jgi:hypothetical protein